MRAQSVYTPKVLSLYDSNAKRLIVKGKDAFAAERREYAFNGSSEHQEYRRMLFKHNGRLNTMEEIFGAPEYTPSQKADIIGHYRFWLSGADNNNNLVLKFWEIIGEVQKMGAYLKSDSFPGVGGSRDCRLNSTRDISGLLKQRGIEPEITYFPVAANAPRIQVW